jgi:cobalt/nickel transport system ATP-binding protein
MGSPVIELSGVTYEYPNGTVGIDGIDLTVTAGEQVAVVGANGSGKSSLLSVAGGLETPDIGNVRLFDAADDPEAVRERLGVLLQNPDDYLFNGSVREDILYGPTQFGTDPDRADRWLRELADKLSLTDLLDRAPFQLSGGEKQRAALACVLAFEPSVLLLDEPVASVDNGNRRRMLEAIESYRERHGATVITVTPDLSLVPSVADRVILLNDGEIWADGPPREVLTDTDLLSNCGLRLPPIVELFDVLGISDKPLTVDAAAKRLVEARGCPVRSEESVEDGADGVTGSADPDSGTE